MRIVIVKATTIAKYRRMDAGFYVGMSTMDASRDEIAKARKALVKAKSRLKKAKATHAEQAKRIARMEECGEITSFP